MTRWACENKVQQRALCVHLRAVQQDAANIGNRAAIEDRVIWAEDETFGVWVDTKSKTRDAIYATAGDGFIAGWEAMAGTLTTVTGLAGNAVSFDSNGEADKARRIARAAELQARVKRCRVGRSDVRAYGIVQTVLGAIREGEIFVTWDGSDNVYEKLNSDCRADLILDASAAVPTHKDKQRAFYTTLKVCILAT